MDRAAVAYAEKLEEQPSSVPETNANTRPEYILSTSLNGLGIEGQ